MESKEAHYNLQIEQAASGCISGTLSEWPALKDALLWNGLELSNETPASTLRLICKMLIVCKALPQSS